MGPMFGFMLGSFCAKLYVDIGAVDLGNTALSNCKQSDAGIHLFSQQRLELIIAL